MNAPPGHPTTTIRCLNCGKRHEVLSSCGNRFCTLCGRKRLNRIRRTMVTIIRSRPFRPGYHWRHWIFTIASSTDPGPAATHLLQSFRRLRQRKFWRSHCSGGFFVLEFTTKGNAWHVHLHVAAYAGYMRVAELRSLWRKVSAGEYVRLGDCPPDRFAGYLTKYLTADKISPENQLSASRAFRNYRLYNAFGFAFKIHIKTVKSAFGCPECGLTEVWVFDGKKSTYQHLRARWEIRQWLGKPPPL